jgi:hypothetical protein
MELGAGLRAVPLREQNVIVLPRIERRVKVDKIDRLVLDVTLENLVVVAVVELIFLRCHRIGMRLAQTALSNSCG